MDADNSGWAYDLDVRLSIAQRNVDQLDIILIGPSGQTVALYTGRLRPWNGGPLFANTIVDDEAARNYDDAGAATA